MVSRSPLTDKKPLRASSQSRSSEYSADSPTSIRVRCTTLRPRVNAISKSPIAFVPGTMRTIRQTNRSQPRQHQTCLDRFSHEKRGRHTLPLVFIAKLYFYYDQIRYLFNRERYTSSNDAGPKLPVCLWLNLWPRCPEFLRLPQWRIAIALVEIRIILLTAILVGLEHKFIIRAQTSNQL